MTHPNSTTVYYHADCLDGFGAAYAAWRHFGDAALYRPLHHGQSWQPEEVSGRDVFILDFSFPPDQLLHLARAARAVRLLDHHASVRDDWAGHLLAGNGGLSLFRHPDLSLTLALDMDKSGARLAWEYFHPGEALPLALAHIEDQDLWCFKLPGTRPFCRALRLQPFAFGAWDAIVRSCATPEGDGYRRMLAEGTAIDNFCALEVERLAAGRLVMPVTLKGEPVDSLQARRHGLPTIDGESESWQAITGLAVNANAVFASELGNSLAEQSGTFGLVWQLSADGEVKASLRAKNRINVAQMARHYGGGGHPNAAGFRLPLQRFVTEVLGAIPA